MKKSHYLIVAIGIVIVLFGILLFLRRDEDTWTCENGQWVKHGNPFAPKPTIECAITETQNNETTESSNSAGRANPASVYCIENGGILNIREDEEGQTGYCTLADGTICEEWAYYRGECPA